VFNFQRVNSWLCRLNIYFMEIRPMWAKLLHSDRRTDMMKLIDAFRNFENTSKNGLVKVRSCFFAASLLGSVTFRLINSIVYLCATELENF